MKEPTVNQLLKTIKDHPWKRLCPVCNEDTGCVGLLDLVFRFEPCDCKEEVRYTHLAKTVYHVQCFRSDWVKGI
jgi:hypothetical protein